MKRDTTIAKVTADNDEAAGGFIDSLSSDECVGLDTEFMRVKTYYPVLCLVQLARADGCLACIDPLPLDLERLGEQLSRYDGVVIIHSAGQDLEVLRHALGYVPRRLFDTQVAAALLGDGEQVSYAALASSMLGMDVAKGETRTDWCRRPLSPAQVEYAFEDVAYLVEMYQMLRERLARAGKLHWMEQACDELLAQHRQPSDDGVVARFRGGSGLPPSSQPLLRDLLLWREDRARALDRPREWVVAGTDLVNIARRRPASGKTLQQCTGLNPAQLRRYADELFELVNRHRDTEPEKVWYDRTDLTPDQRASVKTIQDRVKALCEDLSISTAAVVSRADIEAMVLGRPGRLDGGWRRELLGEALERV